MPCFLFPDGTLNLDPGLCLEESQAGDRGSVRKSEVCLARRRWLNPRAAGKLGVPCFLFPDGTLTLDPGLCLEKAGRGQEVCEKSEAFAVKISAKPLKYGEFPYIMDKEIGIPGRPHPEQ